MSADKNVLDRLDNAIDAIESHRDWRQREAAEQAARLDATWAQVVESARQLRERLKGNPKLRYFTVARDGSEIAISFHRSGGGRSDLLSLHRRHPDGKYPTTDVIWSFQAGRQDGRHRDADEVIDLMVKHCAGNLTTGEA